MRRAAARARGTAGGEAPEKGEERERNRADARRFGDRDEDNVCEEEDDGGTGAWRIGPGKAPKLGKQRQRKGEVLCKGGGPRGERRRER